MKKYIFTISLLFILTTLSANAQTMQRTYIKEVLNNRVFTIIDPESNNEYLIHLKKTCGDLKDNQSINLIKNGDLKYGKSSVKIASYRTCDIDFAEEVSDKLYIDYVFSSNRMARLFDKLGNKYMVSYSPACSALRSYYSSYIYTLQSENDLSNNDKFYLPKEKLICSFYNVKKIKNKKENIIISPSKIKTSMINNTKDTKRPSSATNLKAFPRKSSVFLSWRFAKDNKKVAYYVVAYSKSKLDMKHINIEDMDNLVKAKDTQIKIKNLENDTEYFFWVKAVDTSGNISSDWSNMAIAMPKASIAFPIIHNLSGHDLKLQVSEDNPKYFVVSWLQIPGASRYAITLKEDGIKQYTITDYLRRNFKIMKSKRRKGKNLTLKVSAYSYGEYLNEEFINFGF